MRLESSRRSGLLVAAGVVLAAAPLAAQQGQPTEPDQAGQPTPIGWEYGPGFSLSRGEFEVRLGGYVQEDFRSFRDYEAPNGLRPELAPESELRRLRLGVEAKWDRLSVEVDFELHDELEHLKNAFGELRISKALRIRGGNFKVPVSGEWLSSAAKIDFLERSVVASSLAPGRDWGAALTGEPVNKLTYQIGVFTGDGRTDESRAETTVAGRLEWEPARGLDLAVSGSQAEVAAEPEGGPADPRARGVVVRAPSGFRLYERHFVDGRRRRLGADARFQRGPVGFKAEVLRMSEERKGQGSVFDDLPTEVALGWAASATWLVTGDRKQRTIEPRRPIHKGGLGALELAVRYESMSIDDDGPGSGFSASGSRARNIRPVGGTMVTGGVSWWPVEFIRLMGNVVVERYDDALLAPVPGRKDDYVTLLGRLQMSVP